MIYLFWLKWEISFLKSQVGQFWNFSDSWFSSFLWHRGALFHSWLTHWGRVRYICIGKVTIIDSDNGLSPGRHQAIIWTSAGILLIWPFRTNFSEILIEIHTYSFIKMHLKLSCAKSQPFYLGLNVSRKLDNISYMFIWSQEAYILSWAAKNFVLSERLWF